MSMLSLRSKIREDHLTCTICYLRFNRPKALPCLHTFCENCIRDFVFSRGFDQQGKFPCPVCRSEIPIPPGGIGSFADNHLVQSLFDTVDTAKGPVVPPRPNSEPEAMPPASGGEPPLTPISESFVMVPPTGTTSAEDPGPQVQRLYPELPDPSRERSSSGPPTPVVCGEGLLLHFGKYGPTLTDFHKPFGLAVSRDGDFVISDRGGNRILVFTNGGILTKRFGCDCIVNGIAITKDKLIVVAVSQSGSAIMRMYTMDGRLLGKYGDFYRFDKPSGLALTTKNQALITNLESHNVLVFTEQQKFSTKFGWKGSGDKHFISPYFVTSNSKDHVIVSDTGNNCIKVFDIAGNFKYKFGSTGAAHGCLDQPLGVATDSEHNVIVADSGNYRVEIFSNHGHHLSCLVQDTDLIGPGVKPINVAMTPQNNIAVLLSGTQFAEVRVYHWRAMF